jgi:hypothetical protein
MYARSTSFQARPGTIDQGIGYVRDEVFPAAMTVDGCVGLSMICDRQSRRSILTSAWSTREARDSSGELMRPLLEGGASIFGAEPTFDLWEIVVLHRHASSGESACVRCTWLSMEVAGLTKAIKTYRLAMLPALQEMGGFCSVSLMVDRATGRAVSSATFESREYMVASRPAAERMRSRRIGDLGATVTDIQEFELVLAQLHVPELE